MEDLYEEPFSGRKNQVLKTPNPSSLSTEMKNDVIENKHLAEVYEVVNQMNYYLDQLEKTLFNEYSNFADFQFLFRKIRAKLKEKNTEGVEKLLCELEELIDAS